MVTIILNFDLEFCDIQKSFLCCKLAIPTYLYLSNFRIKSIILIIILLQENELTNLLSYTYK